MPAEIRSLFGSSQVEPLGEITSVKQFHESIKNLIRRSLNKNGRLGRRRFIFFPAGHYENDFARFSSAHDDEGFLVFPAGKVLFEDLSADFITVLEHIFGLEIDNIQINAKYKNASLGESDLVLYDSINKPPDRLSIHARGYSIDVTTVVNGTAYPIQGQPDRIHTWASWATEFAFKQLDRHLGNLTSDGAYQPEAQVVS